MVSFLSKAIYYCFNFKGEGDYSVNCFLNSFGINSSGSKLSFYLSAFFTTSFIYSFDFFFSVLEAASGL
jgi:hypothetical protein